MTARSLRLAAIGSSITLVIWLVLVLAGGFLEARYFDSPLVDGPFQLLNALRRIQAGQRPGADFPFFHGAGMPWLHYPSFAIFGGNLLASELTRQWLSPLAFVCSTAAFGWIACGRRLAETVLFSCLAVLAMFPLGVAELYLPGASMLGLRSTAPIVFFTVMLSDLSPKRKTLIGSLLLAITLVVGTEQGVYLTAAIICTIGLTALVIRKYGSPNKTIGLNFRVLAWTTVGGWLIYPVFLAVLCGPRGVLPALRFAFSELPADQFWFHGVPPNTFAASIFSLRAVGERAVLVIALGSLWWTWTLREVSRGIQGSGARLLMLSTGLFACASYTGMLSARYYAPLARVVVFCALAGLIIRIRLFSIDGRQARYLLAAWAILAFGPGMWGPASAFQKKSRRPADFAGGREISGSLFSPDLSRHINMIESITGPLTVANRGMSLWSTYAGIIEASTGKLDPAEDYIIHALGPARRAHYVETFERSSPEFVLTMRADKMVWEEWLRNEDWPFYEQLLEHYEIAAVTPFSLIWKKLPGPPLVPAAPIALPVGNGHDPILLPYTNLVPDSTLGACPAIFIVDVRYQIDNPFRRAPLLGSMARYFINIEGAVNHTPMSLSPYYESMRFPVLLKTGSQARLVPQTRSIVPGPSFTIKAISIQSILLYPHQKDFLARGPEFWLP